MLLFVLLELVALETRIEKESYFVYEPLPVTLVVRYDAEKFREQGVQMFPRELDLPVRIEAAWLDGIPGTILRPPASAGGVSFALNDEIVEGERTNEELVIRRTFVPTSPGELVLAAPILRYAMATKFREDFVHGRMPVDRTDYSVEGVERRVRILPLPSQGRPRHFCGAVGRFAVRADADPGELEPEQIFQLVLRIEGDGNLANFDTPRLDGLAGFHIYGSVDDRGSVVRTVTYELAPLDASVQQVPSIRFDYFDPGEAAYRSARTAAIAVRVRGRPQPAEERSWRGYLLVALGVATLLVLLRLRGRREPNPAERAAAVFHAGGTFEEFLASLLACAPAAVISPDLDVRMRDAGVAGELAARAAALVERRVAARYGGAQPGEAERQEAAAIVNAISAASPGGSGA
ncbi:MAG: BatD family protein [Planctomycetota bacterium]